jgi:hypothetical protein
MALSFTSFTGDGTNRNYAVAFPYISRDHVSLTVNGTAVTFAWLSDSLVQATVAPANGSLVVVKRATPVNAPLVDFSDGSTLTETDLDLVGKQNVYLAQETNDEVTAHALLMDVLGNFTARAKRLTNLADPTSAQDASTKAYVDAKDSARKTYVDAADAAQQAYTDSRIVLGQSYADAAAASAANADAASVDAAASAASIIGDAASAAASAAAANADKNTVAADKATTLGYKNDAETAAAATAADKATTLGYKNAAAASAAATATSETNAAASAASALADKNTVAADKATTLGYKNAAAASAAATATSETNAAASAASALADKNTVAADKTTTLGYKNDAAASAAAANAAVAAAAAVTDTQLATKAGLTANNDMTGTNQFHGPQTLKFGGVGAGFWMDGNATAQSFFMGTDATADKLLRIYGYAGGTGFGQIMTIDAVTGVASFNGPVNFNGSTFNFTKPNGVANSGTAGSTMGKIIAGSATNPVTTATPLVAISRTESINVGTEGAQNAALLVESVGQLTSGTTWTAMTTAVSGVATSNGYGDSVGVWGQSKQNSTTAGRYGYGGFFLASAYHVGSSAFGVEMMVDNSTGTAAPFIDINNIPKFAGTHICALANECTTGLYIDGSSGGSFSVGALFRFNINYAAIVDTSVATYSYKDTGSHTVGIDLSGGTYSQHSFKAPGMRIDKDGCVIVDASPTVVPTIKSQGATLGPVANGGSSSVLAMTNGLLMLQEITGVGSGGAYYLDGGFGATLISAGGAGYWVAPTTTPAAGKMSVCYDGTTGFRVYNNRGGSSSFFVGQWQI